jgi:Skp family chaperone for outer membrane proteins
VQSTPVVAVQLSYIASGSITGIGLVLVGTAFQRHDDSRVIREIVTELRDRFDDVEQDLQELTEKLTSLEAAPVRRSQGGRKAS